MLLLKSAKTLTTQCRRRPFLTFNPLPKYPPFSVAPADGGVGGAFDVITKVASTAENAAGAAMVINW